MIHVVEEADTPPELPLISASLGVFGTFEPDELSDLLGVKAKVGRVRDVRPGGGRHE